MKDFIWKNYNSKNKEFCNIKITQTYQARAELSEKLISKVSIFTPKVYMYLLIYIARS